MLNPDDPLIQVPIDLESYVADAMVSGSSSDVVSLMADYFREVVVRMSGFDTVGTPLVPPDEHVLDHLARAWDLVDAETAAKRPSAGTVACPVDALECDICGERARYETYVSSRGDRVQVYACLECTRQHGDPILGAGASVYLMDFDEVSSAVREVCDEIRRRQGIGSIWGEPDADPSEEDPQVANAPAAERENAELRSVLSQELLALRGDADRILKTFKVDEDGNYEVKRRDYEVYCSFVSRARQIKTVLATSSSDADDLVDAPQSGAASAKTAVPAQLAPRQAAPAAVPDSMAVSARLRALWVNTIGPLLEGAEHDLAGAWSRAVVQRLGSEVIIRGPIDFGDGNPFEGAFGAQIKELFELESCGLVRDVRYEFADRDFPKLRRARTTSSDIFHPEDVAAPDAATAARAIGAQLAGAGADTKPVLARLTVAGVAKFRLWLAVPSEGDRKAVGATPGAASALMMAVAKFQRSEALCDIVVDPDAWERYPRLDLS